MLDAILYTQACWRIKVKPYSDWGFGIRTTLVYRHTAGENEFIAKPCHFTPHHIQLFQCVVNKINIL